MGSFLLRSRIHLPAVTRFSGPHGLVSVVTSSYERLTTIHYLLHFRHSTVAQFERDPVEGFPQFMSNREALT